MAKRVAAARVKGLPAFEPTTLVGVAAISSAPMTPASGLAAWEALKDLDPRWQVVLVAEALRGTVDDETGVSGMAADLAEAAKLKAADFFRQRERAWSQDPEGAAFLASMKAQVAKILASRSIDAAPRAQRDAFVFPTMNETLKRVMPKAKLPDDSVRILVAACPAAALVVRLRYGGWNECPEPAWQGPVLEHWRKTWGARLVFVGPDTLEFRVERPPQRTTDVATLAWEQYLYCNDIVDQGTGTLGALAAVLVDAKHWYFWWD